MVTKAKINKQNIFGSASWRDLSQDELNQMIQKKAYELYEKRGRVGGNEWSNWLEAEKIIKSSRY